ncbi:lytic transglycosylase domain-containing protein [Erythrobacteraceae bacterium CFH 75059]|uniref:lytic transglycosylase domain-containing protein n=1 Tax=Qipengyuania thermophila TaxID=2509361 RepID=UPI001021435A|nr:lytic transglycosylase domain-containing protein [Qipengyuania thermophila]TCD05326.1 lytic transglycosylase domain-containing protein [Erythrobacteraceae bacterium CFH 75059]
MRVERLLGAVLCACSMSVLPVAAVAQEVDLSQLRPPPAAPVLSEREAIDAALRAFDRADWPAVSAALAGQADTALKGFIMAEMHLAAGSPRTEAHEIAAWLQRYPDLPQAEQMLRLGQRRGLTMPVTLPGANPTSRGAPISKRVRPRTTGDGTMPQAVADAIQERIRTDDPDGARLLLDGVDATLSPEARAEWRQRVAWSYYIENRDSAALTMAQTVRDGRGPWLAEGEWTVGLAAWRLGDCATAFDGFARAAGLTGDTELADAAHFWAARAAARCRQPERAQHHLRLAARNDETLYGMLARERLGQPLPAHTVHPLSAEDRRIIARSRNAQLATQLAERGRDAWASRALQHEVLTGEPRHFGTYARLARELNLPRTQVWMSMNVPRGAVSDPALRYPTVTWQPTEGWRVDPALAFAHALQESDFVAGAVSSANAIGLMQVRPIAARDVAGRTNLDARHADLRDPATNLTFGQRNLEKLSEASATQGTLLKVMAAYNAGLSPVTRWNAEIMAGGDPLLWMESIPFWETRGYVAVVLRNYWMYLRQRDQSAPSRLALAQNEWPMFPR